MAVNFSSTDLTISAGFPAQFPADVRPQIAFSGRSNVGKSSLINTLLGRKALARVSASPGKTVTINFYDVDKKLYFVDLPGYGFAKRSDAERRRFSTLTDGYFVKNDRLDLLRLVVQLVDIRIGPTDDDRTMIDFLIECKIPFLIAVSKADKLSKTAASEAVAKLQAQYPDVTVIPFSSLNGLGKESLRSAILSAAELS
ncbi:MAG: YihA family ribosome biogenesis GTP-binding protein [Clostridia bacterium]|nr:YihA family ribosome biogenesis GTP-binding protein [Clostridia bacterium]